MGSTRRNTGNVTSTVHLDKLGEQMRANAYAVMDHYAPVVKEYAKINAPWHDISGNARNSIQAESGPVEDGYAIVLSGGMFYSVFLELSNERKYAILKPTLDRYNPEIGYAVAKSLGIDAKLPKFVNAPTVTMGPADNPNMIKMTVDYEKVI